MEIEVSGSGSGSGSGSAALMGKVERRRNVEEKDRARVKRKDLEAVLEQCQRALELLSNADSLDDDDENIDDKDCTELEEDANRDGSSALPGDQEIDELCNLLKSRVECPDFLEKLECARVSVQENIPECSSWDLVSEDDLWKGENVDSDEEDYVLVSQEDIIDGIACFMAAYLLSVKQTKDLTPNQLQEALSKTFSVKKKKGKLRKAWDGSKVIYNVASWGATAIGIYQNPVIIRAASKAVLTSFHLISKLL
ncbi:hypothetical protein SLEP1_g20963 [Rubroshorea leprosula]|uniref:Uncharacterized protein n=1 Tax=Rubroshorea leprosula TaxID=152421 RepID=A0AAV5JD78_9ROSI|nr:hypothetical protein SLEP1_g20963 [Rubroshorea leprosula]